MKESFMMAAAGAVASCAFVHIGFGVFNLEPALLAAGEGVRRVLGLA